MTMKLNKIEQFTNEGWISAADGEGLIEAIQERLHQIEQFVPWISIDLNLAEVVSRVSSVARHSVDSVRTSVSSVRWSSTHQLSRFSSASITSASIASVTPSITPAKASNTMKQQGTGPLRSQDTGESFFSSCQSTDRGNNGRQVTPPNNHFPSVVVPVPVPGAAADGDQEAPLTTQVKALRVGRSYSR